MSLAPSYGDRFQKYTLNKVVVVNDDNPNQVQVAICRTPFHDRVDEWSPCVLPSNQILTYDEVYDYLQVQQDQIERRYFLDMAAHHASRERIDTLFVRD